MNANFKHCPCGSGRDYAQCCGRYIDAGDVPEYPEQLMRSRYTAYVLCHSDYLLRTWQVDNRPLQLDLEQGLNWLGLEIVDCQGGSEAGESEGIVEFIARFKSNGRVGALHERSRFIYENDRWYYVDGNIFPQPEAVKTSRNALCPCGSGKKFKRCCG